MQVLLSFKELCALYVICALLYYSMPGMPLQLSYLASASMMLAQFRLLLVIRPGQHQELPCGGLLLLWCPMQLLSNPGRAQCAAPQECLCLLTSKPACLIYTAPTLDHTHVCVVDPTAAWG